jgi:hypothetical protein
MRSGLLWLAAALLLAGATRAEPWAVGDALPPLALVDQHGAALEVDASVRVLIFSREMEGGGIVKEALATGGADFLAAHRAVYVADVSRMPGLVRTLFALPAMRRRDYRIALDEQGDATRDFPSVEGTPTVLALDAGRITSIANPESVDALRSAVAAAAGTVP